MIVIVASSYDSSAASLAERWRTHDARLLTPRDLSQPGSQYRSGNDSAGKAVIAGEIVPTKQIRIALNCLPGIWMNELLEIVSEDREYIAVEMSAFLLAWLTSLGPRVHNRPTPTGLSGPFRRTERWRHIAAQAGVPIRPIYRRAAPDEVPALPQIDPDTHWGVTGTQMGTQVENPPQTGEQPRTTDSHKPQEPGNLDVPSTERTGAGSAGAPANTGGATGAAPVTTNPVSSDANGGSRLYRPLTQVVAPEATTEMWATLRVALIEQANIWQALMNGSGALKDYPAQGVATALLRRAVADLRDLGRGEASGSLNAIVTEVKDDAQNLLNLTTELAAAAQQEADVLTKAVQNKAAEYWANIRPYLLGALLFVGVTCLVLVVVIVSQPNGSSTTAFAAMSSLVASALGLLGINIGGRQAASGSDSTTPSPAQETVSWLRGKLDQLTGSTTSLQQKAENLAAAAAKRVQMVEQAAIATFTDILHRVEAGIQDTTHRMNYSVGVSYPLLDWYIRQVPHTEAEDVLNFVHSVLWTDAETETLKAHFEQAVAAGLYGGWQIISGQTAVADGATTAPGTDTTTTHVASKS